MKCNVLFYFYSLSIELFYYVYYYHPNGYRMCLFQFQARKKGKTENNVNKKFCFYLSSNFCRVRRIKRLLPITYYAHRYDVIIEIYVQRVE